MIADRNERQQISLLCRTRAHRKRLQTHLCWLWLLMLHWSLPSKVSRKPFRIVTGRSRGGFVGSVETHLSGNEVSRGTLFHLESWYRQPYAWHRCVHNIPGLSRPFWTVGVKGTRRGGVPRTGGLRKTSAPSIGRPVVFGMADLADVEGWTIFKLCSCCVTFCTLEPDATGGELV
jgi:hypothetical protein